MLGELRAGGVGTTLSFPELDEVMKTLFPFRGRRAGNGFYCLVGHSSSCLSPLDGFGNSLLLDYLLPTAFPTPSFTSGVPTRQWLVLAPRPAKLAVPPAKGATRAECDGRVG